MHSTNSIFTAPVYSAELAPPGLRGLFVGMNGVNIALGYVVEQSLSIYLLTFGLF
jgi:hypothetical protein